MRKFTLFLTAILLVSLTLSAQVTPFENNGSTPSSVNKLSFTNDDFFTYIWLNEQTIHFVWDELPGERVNFYVLQQSKDGVNYNVLDSLKPENLFDIFRNNYPKDRSNENTIMYSTETGNGRFIYNDVLTASEMSAQVLFYRVKIVTSRGVTMYTKPKDWVLNKRGSHFNTLDDASKNVLSSVSNANLPAQLNGNNAKPGVPGAHHALVVCPDVQVPPSGYFWTGGEQTFYGDCCFWTEREYQLQNITAPCGGASAWCCPFDCSPVAYDPCCVHTCGDYNDCSCHPWTCCNTNNATIWVVTASTTYALNATVTNTKNPSCNGGFDGSITINTTAGIAPVLTSWSNGVLTGGPLVDLAAGVYSITVYDGNQCEEVLSVTLADPPVLNSQLTVNDVSCFGLNDGSIDVAVSGGVPPYTYNWTLNNNPHSTSQDLIGIGPGNYALTITDAATCVNNYFQPIFSPDEFTGVITFQDLGCPIAGTAVLELCCYGSNTGSAVLSLSGGTPPMSFAWSNGSSANINTDLTAGTYTVTAIDANGCSFSTSATLGEPDEIQLTDTVTDAACGQCNGTATVIATGGSTVYTYQWPSTAGSQTTATATGLCAGSYTVIVSDVFAVGCFKSITVSVSNIGGERITTTKTDASCFNICDGTATVAYTCGNPPCTQQWFDPQGNPLSTDLSVSALCGGDYSVVVTNATGCITSETVTIGQAASINPNISVVNETCPGACDGIASAAPVGGTSPYTFSWLDSTGAPTGQTGTLVTALCAGSYSVVITDASGCSETFAFTINSSSGISGSTQVTQNLCFGECNGAIVVSTQGGVAPFTVTWSQGGATLPTASGFSLSNLCPDVYAATVTDGNGCTYSTGDITITAPDQLTASVLNIVDILCTGTNGGSAEVSASGGTGALTYQWFNGFTVAIAGETGTTIDSLFAGDYFVQVTDSNGCTTGLIPFTIADINPLTAVFTSNDVSCNGAGDGGIDLEVTGGFPPYTYSWNNGQFTTQDIDSLPAGSYTVVITDSSGCAITDSGTIGEPALLTVPLTVKTYGAGGYHVTCNGLTDGAITADPVGGTGPYTYLWSDSSIGDAAIGLGLGTYTVTVTDANGCTATATDSLFLEPGPFTSDLTAYTYPSGFNVSCFGASDAFLFLVVTGGEPPFIFNWNDDAYLEEDPDSVPAGLYTVNIVDTALGCIIRDTILLTSPSEIVPTLTPSLYPGGVNVSTMGGNDGSIDLEVTGGVPPYEYLWSTGDTTQDIDSLTAGTYTCTITDTIGCSVIASITLRDPQPSLEVIDTTICEGGFVFAGGANQTTTGTYVDSFLNFFGLDSIIITNLTVLPASRTTVDVTICFGQSHFAGGADQTATGAYFDTLAAANGCDSIITTNLTVTNNIAVAFQVTDAGCDALCDGAISMTFVGGNPPLTIQWSNGDTVQNLTSLCGGTYTVTVTDADGCQGVGSATVGGGQPIALNVTSLNNSCVCVNQTSNFNLCVIDFAGLPHGTVLGEQYAGDGVHITAQSFGATGFNQLIVFNTGVTGSQDPDLQVNAGNIAIFPQNITDANNDGIIDAPNDHTDGGVQIYSFDTPRDVVSFKFIDKENPPGKARAYDAQGNLIKTVVIPYAGNGSIQTVQVNAQGVSRLEIDYNHDSGGVTEITLGCIFTCCDGEATATPTGGTAPYTYVWSNGETTATIDELCIGTYTVTVTDANGCSNTGSATVGDFVEIEVTVTTTDLSPACGGNRMCELNFGDFPPGTLLNEQYAQYGIHISGDAYGTWPDQVIIYDADGNGPDPDLETADGHLAIFPENLNDQWGDGVVDRPNDQSAGGVMTITFDYDRTVTSFVFVDKENGGASFAKVYDANNTLIKTVGIPVAGNGSVQTIAVNATGVRKLVFDYRGSGGVTDILLDCEAQCCDGTGTATATGGRPPYTYEWDNGETTQTAVALCPGDHTVTVTDADGCTSTQTSTVGDCELSVSSLTIVREHFGGDVAPFVDGMTISLDTLCPFNIRANLCIEPVGSVKFILNGATFRVEEYIPYSLAGDNPTGDYHDFISSPGSYTLDVIPYTEPYGGGTAGATYSTSFTVIGQPCGAAPKQGVQVFESIGNQELQLTAYPNPFTEQVQIKFALPTDERVRLEVVTVDGRLVSTIFEGNTSKDEVYQVTFKGEGLPDGMYFYRLITESGEIHNRKLLLHR